MRILRNKLGKELPIRTEKNFPIEGIEFIDLVPLTLDNEIFQSIVDNFVQKIKSKNVDIDYIVSPEARGFLFGTAVAKELGVGFIPVRKSGKLPPTTVKSEFSYKKEYGVDRLTLPKLMNDEYKGKKVYIIDDIYATGNTVKAIKGAIKDLGAKTVGTGVIINIVELNHDRDMYSILDVNEE